MEFKYYVVDFGYVEEEKAEKDFPALLRLTEKECLDFFDAETIEQAFEFAREQNGAIATTFEMAMVHIADRIAHYYDEPETVLKLSEGLSHLLIIENDQKTKNK